MTRGRIYLCDNSGAWYKTTLFISDMYPDFPIGHGSEIILSFLKRYLRNHSDLLRFTEEAYKKWFNKNIFDEYERDEIVIDLWNAKSLCLENVYDDYSYILNCSKDSVNVIVEGREVHIEKDEMLILSYSDIYMRLRRNRGRKTIILNNDDITECINALDFYIRMYLGQYNNIDLTMAMNLEGEDMRKFRADRFTREKLYTAIRSRVFKDTDISEWELNGSLGIWCDETSDNAKCAYDILQMLRYNRANTCHPEGGFSVDFNTPLIKGSLPVIECICKKENDIVTETVRFNYEHFRIIDDALRVYYYFKNVEIMDIFKYYTDDSISIKIVSIVQELYKGVHMDKKYSDIINNLRLKFMYACLDYIELSENAGKTYIRA